jgi:hypothetical protein
VILAGGLLAAAWVGCTTSQPFGPQTCQGGAGDENCSCMSDGSCKTNLVCAIDLGQCVHLAGAPPPLTGGTTGSISGGSSGTGGTHVTGTGASTSGGSTGKGGGAGVGGSGGGLERGPTPPKNGANFPFPQNRQVSSCVYPAAYNNDDVRTAYAKWKSDLVVSDAGAGGFQRVQRTPSDLINNSVPLHGTVSEGIGYGLIIAVYMGDQMLFDNLWKYEQLHLDGNGLMTWSIDASGNSAGQGAATDADEDMAWALVMADKQWGGSGSLSKSYHDFAVQQIQAIWNHEIFSSKLADAGDNWMGDQWGNVNISYFAPSYYRVFKQMDPDSSHAWDAVTQTVYDTILGPSDDFSKALSANNKNNTNGLVPGWCTSDGAASGAGPFNYQYDACRTPFRIGIDWCLNASTAASAMTPINPSRAQKYVALTSSFFSGIGAAHVVDGYNLDGSPNPQNAQGQSAAFLGPAAVGAMNSATYQSFVNDAYALLKTNNLLVGGAYYDESWTVMSLLMLTGNFLDYTQLTPAK